MLIVFKLCSCAAFHYIKQLELKMLMLKKAYVALQELFVACRRISVLRPWQHFHLSLQINSVLL